MGRCPQYLNVDDFDRLSNSIGISLTDTGVSALGEICEYLAVQLIKEGAKLNGGNAPLDFDIIIRVAMTMGVKLELETSTKTVRNASLRD